MSTIDNDLDCAFIRLILAPHPSKTPFTVLFVVGYFGLDVCSTDLYLVYLTLPVGTMPGTNVELIQTFNALTHL